MRVCKSYLHFSRRASLVPSDHCVPPLEELHQDWIPNAMFWVASEGDGDGVASAPVNLFHPMQIL